MEKHSTLNLKSSDGKVIQASTAIKDMSVLIKEILQGTGLCNINW